jgi:hypothetical protein
VGSDYTVTTQGAMHVFNCLMGDLTIILFIIEWAKPDVRVVRCDCAPVRLCTGAALLALVRTIAWRPSAVH